MIYLHKILPVVALPSGLTLLLAAAGLLLRRRGLLAVLWVASLPLAGDAAMRAAEGGQVRRALHEIPPARAIVVLSPKPVAGNLPAAPAACEGPQGLAEPAGSG
ncbi:MAG: hypothetical protein FJ011_25100 [Chloroflexi bacterium]|nr:hypothetical protein [Chloroflexota bacterium]